jgi:hypothetical protein
MWRRLAGGGRCGSQRPAFRWAGGRRWGSPVRRPLSGGATRPRGRGSCAARQPHDLVGAQARRGAKAQVETLVRGGHDGPPCTASYGTCPTSRDLRAPVTAHEPTTTPPGSDAVGLRSARCEWRCCRSLTTSMCSTRAVRSDARRWGGDLGSSATAWGTSSWRMRSASSSLRCTPPRSCRERTSRASSQVCRRAGTAGAGAEHEESFRGRRHERRRRQERLRPWHPARHRRRVRSARGRTLAVHEEARLDAG